VQPLRLGHSFLEDTDCIHRVSRKEFQRQTTQKNFLYIWRASVSTVIWATN